MEPNNSYTLKDIIEEFRKDTKESLNRIEVQTTMHNGRMTKVEKELGMGTGEPTKISVLINESKNLRDWKNYLLGAWLILLILGSTVITLAIMAIDGKIQKGIVDALEASVSRVEYENQ